MLKSPEYEQLLSDLKQAVQEIRIDRFQALSSGLGLGDLQRAVPSKKSRSGSGDFGSSHQDVRAYVQPAPVAKIDRPQQNDQIPVYPRQQESNRPQFHYPLGNMKPSTSGERHQMSEIKQAASINQVPMAKGRGTRLTLAWARSAVRWTLVAFRVMAVHIIDLAVVVTGGALALALVILATNNLNTSHFIAGTDKMLSIVLGFQPSLVVVGIYVFFVIYFALFYFAVGATFGQLVLGNTKKLESDFPIPDRQFTTFES